MIKKIPWFRNLKKTDPEPPLRLPIACGPVSNGEGWWPDSARKRLIRKLVNEKAEEVSRREGIDRREFMASACGMATTLYMINMVNGCSTGKTPPGGTNPGLGMGGSGPAPGAGMAGGGAGMAAGGAGTASGGSGTTGGGSGSSSGGSSGGSSDGGFQVPEDAMTDPELAECLMKGNGELIIDMQSHFATPETNPLGAAGLAGFIGQINNQRYPWIMRTPGCTAATCYDRQEYIQQIIMGSDTTIGVLSGISYSLGADGMNTGGFAALSNEDLKTGAEYLSQMYPGRILTHCMVMPNDRINIQLEMMTRNAASYTNWKTYPPWSPGGNGGYWLHEGVGPQMIQKGLDLGAPVFCIHKGFPLSSFSPTYTNPQDVGPAAKMFPEAYFVIYHSAFEHGLAPGESTQPDLADPNADVGWGPGVGMWPEGPYDDQDAAIQEKYPLDRGVNSLIKSLRDNNIGPNGKPLDGSGPTVNVYAECGGVWPNLLMGRVEEAMHYWGKLLKHLGEDRIVWGTDCLWFGSPQPVIQAFRMFEISTEFQQKYGYPALTQTAKEKILGQNAARIQAVRGVDVRGKCHKDIVGMSAMRQKQDLDEEFGARRDMMVNVWGPRTRRDFLRLRSQEHKEKVLWSGRIPGARG